MMADSLTAKNVQCFVLDKTLLSVVSYPRHKDRTIEVKLLHLACDFSFCILFYFSLLCV